MSQAELSSHVLVDEDSAEIRAIPAAGGTAVCFSVRAPDKEPPNEDAALVVGINETAGVLAVADGAGGLPSGAQASQIAVTRLLSGVQEAVEQGSSIRSGVLDGFERANREVIDLRLGAATTLAVVELTGAELRPYHVGDSSILVVGQRRRLKLLTLSHSPVGYAVEAGLLDPRDAMMHEERSVVSNFVGTADMRIEVGSSLKLAARDTALLASDGLFDNLHTEEIVDLIRTGPLPRAAQRLRDTCLDRMRTPTEGQPSKPDDLTVILFRRTPDRRSRR